MDCVRSTAAWDSNFVGANMYTQDISVARTRGGQISLLTHPSPYIWANRKSVCNEIKMLCFDEKNILSNQNPPEVELKLEPMINISMNFQKKNRFAVPSPTTSEDCFITKRAPMFTEVVRWRNNFLFEFTN